MTHDHMQRYRPFQGKRLFLFKQQSLGTHSHTELLEKYMRFNMEDSGRHSQQRAPNSRYEVFSTLTSSKLLLVKKNANRK